MKQVLNSTSRKVSLSSGDLKKARLEGSIPAIIFGKETETNYIFVNRRMFEREIQNHGNVLNINVNGTSRLVSTREIQKNAIGTEILHISFHEVKSGVLTTVEVLLKTLGTTKTGGSIHITKDKIKLKGMPNKIPRTIEVDISNLQMGESIHVKDLTLPVGVTFHESVHLDDDVIICMQSKNEEIKAEEEVTIIEAP
jgi:large subunit ribosomal protein L25